MVLGFIAKKEHKGGYSNKEHPQEKSDGSLLPAIPGKRNLLPNK